MIYGIGTDICSIERIQNAVDRHRDDRFAKTILTVRELDIWREHYPVHAVRYLASRFAAKEALSKALGTGIRSPMLWHNCEVVNEPSGQPSFVLHNDLLKLFEDKQLIAHLTIADEREYAVAFVVVERIAC
jgi:holo-[acyl-carrier protein] synthase